MGLEAHQVVDRAFGVVPPQLHHGVRLSSRPGVPQPPGLQGAVAQRIPAPAGHDLHGHTALKDHLVLKAVDLCLLGSGEGLPEGLVLRLVHGAVDVVRRTPVVPGTEPGQVHVHALGGHQRGCRVVEVEGAVRPQQGLEPVRQGVGGQGTGGHHHLPAGDVRHLPLRHRDVGVAFDPLRHQGGEAVAVHRQGAAGLHPRLIGAPQDQRAQAAELLLQKAHGVFQLVAAQGVGTAELREAVRCVGGGPLLRLHLPEGHLDSPLGQLPGAFAAGQAGAYDGYVHKDCLLWDVPARGGGDRPSGGAGVTSAPESGPADSRW